MLKDHKNMNSAYSFFVIAFVSTVLLDKSTDGVELGKLQCTENGIYPDDKLIGLVMQKCQPKLDDPRDVLIACVTKCMMKQLKALTKKGKMKKGEAKKLINMLPEEYQGDAKSKFEECYKEHHSKVKKESKCDSWVPFSKCFIGFAESLCKVSSSSTTTAAP